MQIPIQKITKQITRYFPYLVIFILLLVIFFQRRNTSSEIKEIERSKKEILSKNKELKTQNQQLMNFIDKSLSERTEIIEKHYHTKEVVNNKILEHEKYIDNIDISNDSLYFYLSNYRYKPFWTSGN